MGMRVDIYHDADAPAVADLFNRQTAAHEHVIPLTADALRQVVIDKPYFDPQGMLLAWADGGNTLLGYVHACVVPYTDGPQLEGPAWPRIVMLLFESDRPDVGIELVRRATDWLRHHSDEAPTYLHPHRGYPFYRGLWYGGEPQAPLTFPHVQMALAAGGYRQTHQDVMMVAQLTSPPPRLEAACAVDYEDIAKPLAHEVQRASWIGFFPRLLTARIDGRWAGECAYVMLPQAAAKLGRPSMSIYNLAVESRFRRRGIAAALISRAQQVAFDAGARTMTVCTNLDNAPAHATYYKCGYRPHTVVNGRTWQADAAN